MESPEYRDVLADLEVNFGNAWITTAELARYDGQDTRTIKKRYGIPDGVNGINRAVLARRICNLAK